MSGESSFIVSSELHSLFIGAGISIAWDGDPAPHFEREIAEMKRRYERAAHDVKGVLLAMRDDDGVPFLPLDDTGHAGLQLEGRSELTAHRWRLDVKVGRALSEGERAFLARSVDQLLWPPLPPVRRVHHLNCCTMCPLAGPLWNEHKRLVTHVLLVETEQGLVLVDTGVGKNTIAAAADVTSATFRLVYGPRFDEAETAAAQVERLGHKLDDVRHIVLTHMDVDHAGGLSDFPRSTVHAMRAEKEAASSPSTFFERQRYSPALWAHDVAWALHDVKGERWYGFPCVRDIPGLPPEILMVPLVGHTRGHCGVAVDVGGRWLLHAGDAYFHKDEVHAEGEPGCPPALRLHQRLLSTDDAARRANQARLRELQRGVGEGITVFSAHDPDELTALAAALAPGGSG